MVKIRKKKQESSPQSIKRGAPEKDDGDKINQYHVRTDQWKRIVDEAAIRNIGPFQMLRMIVDWFFTALDTNRADASSATLFDDVVKDGKNE